MNSTLELNNVTDDALKQAIDMVKGGGITCLVFKGYWSSEYRNVFRMIEKGQSNVKRMYFEFDAAAEIGACWGFRDAVHDLFMSPDNTVELFDFSKMKSKWGIAHYFRNFAYFLSFRTRYTLNPYLYIRAKPEKNNDYKALMYVQNKYRLILNMLVLSCGKDWKRGTSSSVMKKFPRDLVRLTATFCF